MFVLGDPPSPRSKRSFVVLTVRISEYDQWTFPAEFQAYSLQVTLPSSLHDDVPNLRQKMDFIYLFFLFVNFFFNFHFTYLMTASIMLAGIRATSGENARPSNYGPTGRQQGIDESLRRASALTDLATESPQKGLNDCSNYYYRKRVNMFTDREAYYI